MMLTSQNVGIVSVTVYTLPSNKRRGWRTAAGTLCITSSSTAKLKNKMQSPKAPLLSPAHLLHWGTFYLVYYWEEDFSLHGALLTQGH